MSLETWQRELRRQFGREQPFTLKNVGGEPVFSEYQVTNRAKRRDRIAWRFAAPRRATTTAPVRISPPTPWARASTSSSSSDGWSGNRGDAPGAAGKRFEPSLQRDRPAVRREAGSQVPAGHGMSEAPAGRSPPRYFGPEGTLRAERVCDASSRFCRRPRNQGTTSGAMTMSWASWPRCATGRDGRA